MDFLSRHPTAALIAVTFLATTFLELLRPLRQVVESKGRRVVRNLAVGGTSLAVVTLLQTPLLVPLSALVVRRKLGILPLLPLHGWAATAAAVLLLDYTLWHWHWLNHKVPFLWRFHLVHHVDRDLDASTALRFHFGELLLSGFWRAAQIIVIGASPEAVGIWQSVLFVAILFHHSNLRLPLGVERLLVFLFVTPRMHGIHHSDIREETDSNWSSILSVWDVLHRTMRLSVPQSGIVIGVPAWQSPSAVTFGRILMLPFTRRIDDWRSAGGSHKLVRAQTGGSPPLQLAG
jgi:sterol desaturase/sphingolipid hydroxylase (fatty acid hydroxylase superfamily)